MRYLDVNYEDKEKAKEFGARWNPKEGKWGFEKEEDAQKFLDWKENQKTKVDVSYEDKEKAKEFGARWNPKKKKWEFEKEEDAQKFLDWKQKQKNKGEKYYIHKKFSINLDGIVADICIDKGMKGFIFKKLREAYKITEKDKKVSINSLKVVMPYLDFKYLLDKDKENPFNLTKDSKKVFVISAEEVKSDSYEERSRLKRNREFLENLTYYIKKTYGNGKTVKDQNFEDNIEIYPLKYHSFPKDYEANEKNYFSLHSKIYLINEKYAFIGSANLTKQGLKTNYETLFFVNGNIEQNKELIKKLNKFFCDIKEEQRIKKIEFEDNIFNYGKSEKNNIEVTQDIEKNKTEIENDKSLLEKIKALFRV